MRSCDSAAVIEVRDADTEARPTGVAPHAAGDRTVLGEGGALTWESVHVVGIGPVCVVCLI